MEHVLSPLVAWENFYVIAGSSAAALTGLQFVVIVLGAEWDAVTYIALERTRRPQGGEEQQRSDR